MPRSAKPKESNFRQRLRAFKLDTDLLRKFKKPLVPEERFILKVILLRERDNLTEQADAKGVTLLEDSYKQMDEIVVDACLKTGEWGRIVSSYLQKKIAAQRQRDGASAQAGLFSQSASSSSAGAASSRGSSEITELVKR